MYSLVEYIYIYMYVGNPKAPNPVSRFTLLPPTGLSQILPGPGLNASMHLNGPSCMALSSCQPHIHCVFVPKDPKTTNLRCQKQQQNGDTRNFGDGIRNGNSYCRNIRTQWPRAIVDALLYRNYSCVCRAGLVFSIWNWWAFTNFAKK